MKTKNQIDRESPGGNLSQDEQNQLAIELLRTMRTMFKALGQHTLTGKEQELRRIYKDAWRQLSIPVFDTIELWRKEQMRTTLPLETELTHNSTVGDHLAVTRHSFGFRP